MDVGVTIYDLDIQESHNHSSNDPEFVLDAFVQDIEQNEDGKYATISYQHLIVQLGELAHVVQNIQ